MTSISFLAYCPVLLSELRRNKSIHAVYWRVSCCIFRVTGKKTWHMWANVHCLKLVVMLMLFCFSNLICTLGDRSSMLLHKVFNALKEVYISPGTMPLNLFIQLFWWTIPMVWNWKKWNIFIAHGRDRAKGKYCYCTNNKVSCFKQQMKNSKR